MFSTVQQRLQNVPDGTERIALQHLFKGTAGAFNNCALATAGLVIHGSAGTVPKTGAAASYYSVNGVLITIAAGVDMPVLVGTVVNATFNVYCFFLDSAGTKTSAMGVAGATLGTVKWPNFDGSHALIGFIIINPTGTGNFVGGTTALDDGTVTPNTVYVSPVGGFDPTFLYS